MITQRIFPLESWTRPVSLSQSIVKQFGINPSLDIVYYADSEQDLKQAILDKKIEAGVMIPENFSRDMSLKKSPQAVIFADCSNIITGGGAVGAASSVLGTMSAGMQLKMLEGNNFYPSAAQTSLGTFSYVDRTLYEPQGDYIRKMSYLLVPAITMQTFLISFFIPLMIRKRKALAAAAPEKRGEELKDGIIRTAVVAGGAVAAQFVVLCVVGLYKIFPCGGNRALSVQHRAFHAGGRGLWRDAGVIYQKAGLLCAAVYDVQQPDYIYLRAYFPVLSDAQMAQHCIQDIFAYCQYCRGTEGCEPEGNRLGRCLAPAGGHRPVYRVLAGGRRRHVRLEH